MEGSLDLGMEDQPVQHLAIDGVLDTSEARQPPKSAEWEQNRATITQLYQIDELPLADVMAIMQQRHHFHASKQMYKKRISKWKIQRNYKKAEKQAVLEHLSKTNQVDSSQTWVTIRGQPLKLDRIVRYSRRNEVVVTDQKSASAAYQSPSDVQIWKPVRQNHCPISPITNIRPPIPVQALYDAFLPSDPGQSLQGPREMYVREKLLYGISQSLEHPRFNLTQDTWLEFIRMSRTLHSAYNSSCAAATKGDFHEAAKKLNLAHDILTSTAKTRCAYVLPILLTAVHESAGHDKFDPALLAHSFCTRLLAVLLGDNHPITLAIKIHSPTGATTEQRAWLVQKYIDIELDIWRRKSKARLHALLNSR